MEGGLINPLALIRTGAAEGVTSSTASAPQIRAFCTVQHEERLCKGFLGKWSLTPPRLRARCINALELAGNPVVKLVKFFASYGFDHDPLALMG